MSIDREEFPIDFDKLVLKRMITLQTLVTVAKLVRRSSIESRFVPLLTINFRLKMKQNYFNISPDQRTISNPLSSVPQFKEKLHDSDTFKANHLDITMHFHCVTTMGPVSPRMTRDTHRDTGLCHTDTERHI